MVNARHWSSQKLSTGSTLLGLLVFLALSGLESFSQALETEPHPLDRFLTDILNFREPTGIRGTVRFIDKTEQNIWLNWEQRSDDRPFFKTGWKSVPGEATLLVYPKDIAQYKESEHIAKGTPIEMIIQLDKDGHRRILSFQNLSLPPQVPL